MEQLEHVDAVAQVNHGGDALVVELGAVGAGHEGVECVVGDVDLKCAIDACGALGGNILRDAFGIVAMVAMTPLIAIEVLGVIYRVKSKAGARRQPATDERAPGDYEIIYV